MSPPFVASLEDRLRRAQSMSRHVSGFKMLRCDVIRFSVSRGAGSGPDDRARGGFASSAIRWTAHVALPLTLYRTNRVNSESPPPPDVAQRGDPRQNDKDDDCDRDPFGHAKSTQLAQRHQPTMARNAPSAASMVQTHIACLPGVSILDITPPRRCATLRRNIQLNHPITRSPMHRVAAAHLLSPPTSRS